MKLLHFSDVHGNMEALARLRKYAETRDDVGLVVFTGDLLGQCLSLEQASTMNRAYRYIANTIQLRQPIPFDKILSQLQFSPDSTPDHAKAAQDFSSAQKEFDTKSGEQYKRALEEILQFPQQVMMIPGNWDSKVFSDIFGEQDLTLKVKEFEGVKFAGYGSAPGIPMVNPPTRALGYSNEEIYNFLMKEDPDVAVVHCPPYGILDVDSNGNNTGCFAALAYMSREKPDILLCGHCHESFGAIQDDAVSTLVSNAGNLGTYSEKRAISHTFVEVEKGKEETKMTPLVFDGDEVKKLADVQSE